MKRIAVIGGGLAGLAGAVALSESEHAVALYERRRILGGRASSFIHPTGNELVDNCQHVLLRCCTNLIDFYEKLGVSDGVSFSQEIPFLDESNQLSIIKNSNLPAPLHLLPSFFRFKALGIRDKIAIGYGMARMLLTMSHLSDYDSQSMLSWLRSHGQTNRTLEAFWHPILVSALNDELDDITASYGIATIVKAFLLNKQGYEVGLPVVPLGDLYEPGAAFLADRGGTVTINQGVSRIDLDNGQVVSVTLQNGETIHADVYLSAVPFDVLLKLLPEDSVKSEPYFSNLKKLEVSPITAVHVWFDRPITDLDFAAVLGRTVQWVFNQTIRHQHEDDAGSYLGLVISASDELMKLPQQEIIDRAMEDLKDMFPLVGEATLVKAIVVKEGRATFAPKPGCDAQRPGSVSPIGNLFVSGDWTQTGWPATMEGAVRSGYHAAEAILESLQTPRRILKPDMPAEGFMRWFDGNP
jgi:squalene-associated FAD-dependent desaturase